MTVSVLWLFFRVPWVGLQFVIVLFPDHTDFLKVNCHRSNFSICSLSWLVYIYDSCQPIDKHRCVSFKTHTRQFVDLNLTFTF